jgi:hypothetical protein
VGVASHALRLFIDSAIQHCTRDVAIYVVLLVRSTPQDIGSSAGNEKTGDSGNGELAA